MPRVLRRTPLPHVHRTFVYGFLCHGYAFYIHYVTFRLQFGSHVYAVYLPAAHFVGCTYHGWFVLLRLRTRSPAYCRYAALYLRLRFYTRGLPFYRTVWFWLRTFLHVYMRLLQLRYLPAHRTLPPFTHTYRIPAVLFTRAVTGSVLVTVPLLPHRSAFHGLCVVGSFFTCRHVRARVCRAATHGCTRSHVWIAYAQLPFTVRCRYYVLPVLRRCTLYLVTTVATHGCLHRSAARFTVHGLGSHGSHCTTVTHCGSGLTHRIRYRAAPGLFATPTCGLRSSYLPDFGLLPFFAAVLTFGLHRRTILRAFCGLVHTPRVAATVYAHGYDLVPTLTHLRSLVVHVQLLRVPTIHRRFVYHVYIPPSFFRFPTTVHTARFAGSVRLYYLLPRFIPPPTVLTTPVTFLSAVTYLPPSVYAVVAVPAVRLVLACLTHYPFPAHVWFHVHTRLCPPLPATRSRTAYTLHTRTPHFGYATFYLRTWLHFMDYGLRSRLRFVGYAVYFSGSFGYLPCSSTTAVYWLPLLHIPLPFAYARCARIRVYATLTPRTRSWFVRYLPPHRTVVHYPFLYSYPYTRCHFLRFTFALHYLHLLTRCCVHVHRTRFDFRCLHHHVYLFGSTLGYRVLPARFCWFAAARTGYRTARLPVAFTTRFAYTAVLRLWFTVCCTAGYLRLPFTALRLRYLYTVACRSLHTCAFVQLRCAVRVLRFTHGCLPWLPLRVTFGCLRCYVLPRSAARTVVWLPHARTFARLRTLRSAALFTGHSLLPTTATDGSAHL